MSVALLVLIALLLAEGSLLAFAPGLVQRIITTASERTLQVAGLIEVILAVGLLLLIYL